MLTLVAYGGWLLYSLETGLRRSNALGAAGVDGSHHGDLNILLMGLDSRLDENGNALPARYYDALHAGDQSSGGENANVLILLHLPGNGAPAVAISIPRDDYADFPGCPDGQCQGKIKQAYGLAFDAKARALARTADAPVGPAREQALRDAGRAAEIAAVSRFLGSVPIDHFVEVTMVAFYQLAQVVQPITVCVSENTADTYSGANFHQGMQKIDAAQAVAFVRQRRDTSHPQLNFTDLDRERRQQAFIASLAYQLRQTSTFVDPSKLTRLIAIAKQNIAVDAHLDLLSFAGDAQRLAGGGITFYTLPVKRFGRDSLGEDVNFVDLPVLQATVRQLLSDNAPGKVTRHSPGPSPRPSAPPAGTVSVLNASGRAHLAATIRDALKAHGYTTGAVGTIARRSASVVQFGPGAQKLALAVAATLGHLPTALDPALGPGSARVVLGGGFTAPAVLGLPDAAATVRSATPVSATAVGGRGPQGSYPGVTQLTALSGGGIRCVK